jgi:hypothetical protein
MKMDGRKGRRRQREGTGMVERKVSPMLAHPSSKSWRRHCIKLPLSIIRNNSITIHDWNVTAFNHFRQISVIGFIRKHAKAMAAETILMRTMRSYRKWQKKNKK